MCIKGLSFSAWEDGVVNKGNEGHCSTKPLAGIRSDTTELQATGTNTNDGRNVGMCFALVIKSDLSTYCSL